MSDELLSVIREEYGRVARTFKTHQKMVDRYNNHILWQKRLNAFLLTVTAGGTIDILLRNELISKIVTLVFTALALFLAIYQLSINLDRAVEQHRATARTLWLLREEYLHLISDLKSSAIDRETARSRRNELTAKTAHVYQVAPDTDKKAHEQAKQDVTNNDDLIMDPEEIDAMLPLGLRENDNKDPRARD